ncbi:hypothetical protein [Hydrogenimonas sp.]
MNRLLILLFGIVSTVAVFILLVLLYRYANQSEEVGFPEKREERLFVRSGAVSEGSQKWLKDLASREKPSYSYAVSEMEISLPLKKRPEPKTSFRLILENLDNYKMFCVRQLLERNGIDFSVFKRGGKAVLMVHDLDRNEQKRIIRMVRKYDVKTVIEKYTKD